VGERGSTLGGECIVSSELFKTSSSSQISAVVFAVCVCVCVYYLFLVFKDNRVRSLQAFVEHFLKTIS